MPAITEDSLSDELANDELDSQEQEEVKVSEEVQPKTQEANLKRTKFLSAKSLEELEDFTLAVFGECGQGKSTLLTKISEINNTLFIKSSNPLKFDASKSLVSVTSRPKIAKRGNMTLIDSPGFNDPNKTRTDKQIFMDLINTIRETLKEEKQGITTFI